MMGMVFTGLMELIEDEFGYETLDTLLESCELQSEGIYTSVGSYDHQELLQLVVKLSEVSSVPVTELVRLFGKKLFVELIEGHPEIANEMKDSFDLLSKIDSFIHVEVYKLYPQAELPKFTCDRLGDNDIRLHYQSKRPFASFAEGLLDGCAEYFKEDFTISRTPETQDSETDVIFNITRAPR
ncbi:heme NO-binding domain-containing protein [Shewanella woodyi]|uniref:Heme NO binding domain protein n=2 Tax=Shewanella woodyi TaxID=60961 RepID=B1KIH6_SHEWM|nr:heme NO-binding domain-containing protein [Shewanella woodyi]ACA87027.1 Heme NO binding domain protein [Shewanella woodyi ATCC 51908]